MINDWHSWLDTGLEIGILLILWVEFNYDKIQDEKREYKEAQKKRKKAKGLESAPLLSSGDKKDVEMVPGETVSPKESTSTPSLVGMCVVCERVHKNPIYFQEWAGTRPNDWRSGPYCTDRQTTKDL